MSQNLFGTLTNPSLPLLDANFSALFDLRELITTPSYTAAVTRLAINSNGDVLVNATSSPSSATGRGNITVNGANSAICSLSIGGAAAGYVYASTTDVQFGSVTNTPLYILSNNTIKFILAQNGDFYPFVDNAYQIGRASNRMSVVYAGTGSINTSDAREKTAVASLTSAEITAAMLMAQEIGTYQWLEAILRKGINARKHVGLTVQRAMTILSAQGLDPLAYGFICYDTWPAQVQPSRTEQRDTGLKSATGEPIYETIVIEPEKVIPAGDRYSFRHDELLLFIARGFEARLSALEAAIAP